ncbi:Phosphopantothenoylcysteine decarboxylase [Lasiodiplodia theobromae]|uniref:Phosphopantothenoylcysteine decarboxylase n=1 Tax=Lasiodiplodia theobromae TaxID=45133 RepID=UPI0015C397BB|nr:Phosphopantothenoylcysteine decarboxylase [Lasiodiplodia theobromae]KAF4540226.1 Phosphopantothenoylcysteine decarboxylase [Lasiodiplodia theobromae]
MSSFTPTSMQLRPAALPLPPSQLNDSKKHLLLAASGSVATIKIPAIITALARHPRLSIRVVLTASAAAFLAGQSPEQPTLASVASLPNVDAVYLDEDEWREPWVRGNSILHIELRRWADLLVVAPLSANTMAKMVGGICDNLLLSTIRAWDTNGALDPVRLPAADGAGDADKVPGARKKRIIVAPAMNTAMWEHPVTSKQIRVLEEEWGIANGGWVEVLRPIEKTIACGDTGSGGMKEWKEIVGVIEERMELSSA